MSRGSLYHVMKSDGPFNDPDAKRIIREVVMGLVYLHKHGIVHRDIKADNILVDDNGNIKLADFGISMIAEAIDEDANEKFEGSPYWMAPEVIERDEISVKSDVW